VWYAIDAAGWHNHLVIEVCTWDNYHQLDPWLEEVYEHKKKLDEAKA
jgi:hypothetical protein